MKTLSVREAKAYLSGLFLQLSSGKKTVKEAKAQIGRLLDFLGDGEDIIITRDGEPIAKLISIDD